MSIGGSGFAVSMGPLEPYNEPGVSVVTGGSKRRALWQSWRMGEDHRNLVNAARRLLVRVPDAEDAVQDTYLKALMHWPDVQAAPSAWLHTVLRNLTLDRLHRNQL